MKDTGEAPAEAPYVHDGETGDALLFWYGELAGGLRQSSASSGTCDDTVERRLLAALRTALPPDGDGW